MKVRFVLLLFICFGMVSAQDKKFNSQDISVSPLIDGTLLLPKLEQPLPLVIIVAGSGPTDRNGNNK